MHHPGSYKTVPPLHLLPDFGDQVLPDPGTVILSSVPDVRQSMNYSCGAAALLAVLSYWGVDTQEGDLMQMMNTNPESGTFPGAITAAAQSYGCSALLKEDLKIDDLKESVQEKVPVIVAMQAWCGKYENRTWVPTPADWACEWGCGHYLVVIGVDSHNVYAEDPALLGTRGIIPINTFLDRWHASFRRGGDPGVTKHLGIFIAGDKPAVYPAYTPIF